MDMENIKKDIEDAMNGIGNLQALNELKVTYLGKKGIITELNSKIKDLPNEEKKNFGQKVNEVRKFFQDHFDNIKEKLDKEELNRKLETERIDISLPGVSIPSGAPSILDKLIEETIIAMRVDEKNIQDFMSSL